MLLLDVSDILHEQKRLSRTFSSRWCTYILNIMLCHKASVSPVGQTIWQSMAYDRTALQSSRRLAADSTASHGIAGRAGQGEAV